MSLDVSRDYFFAIGYGFSAYSCDLFIGEVVPDTHREDRTISLGEGIHIFEDFREFGTVIHLISDILGDTRFPLDII